MLLALKRAIVWLGFGERLVEFCDECGRTTDLVWWAPDSLWNSVVGGYGGIRCTRCFDRECYRRGALLRWRPEVAAHRAVDGEWIPTPEVPP